MIYTAFKQHYKLIQIIILERIFHQQHPFVCLKTNLEFCIDEDFA